MLHIDQKAIKINFKTVNQLFCSLVFNFKHFVEMTPKPRKNTKKDTMVIIKNVKSRIQMTIPAPNRTKSYATNKGSTNIFLLTQYID